MYGRNVFQILQKKGISTEDKFSYGTTKRPNDEVYQSAQRRRLSSFSRIHTIDGAKHTLIENGPVFIALPLYNSDPTFWKSNSGDINIAGPLSHQDSLKASSISPSVTFDTIRSASKKVRAGKVDTGW